MDMGLAKKLLREQVWNDLETRNIATFSLPCFERIPNFVGSEKATQRVRNLTEWKKAKVVFASLDYAQKKIREYALSR